MCDLKQTLVVLFLLVTLLIPYRGIAQKAGNGQMSPEEVCVSAAESKWESCKRIDFKWNGRDAIIVFPEKAAPGNPWIWRPAFFGAFPSVDKALLQEGFHVVYYDLTHLYGSPRAMEEGDSFYAYVTDVYSLSPKVTLEGFSRGGYCALNWGIRNPEKVACIYVDAPVCDIFSWPGRKQYGLWNDFLKEWGLTDNEMASFSGNPLDNLKPLAEHKIPVMAVCGDADDVVPFKENSQILFDRYREMGGPVELILKPGVGHHPHSLENPEPVADFILRNQAGYREKLFLNKRGSLQNSYTKFKRRGKARVAFMGGSITEMNGWRTMICEDLKQRFPDTEFDFVAAGISSTGTTPGAFRLENDILSKGPVDLLFVEAAVNDDTNYFNYIEQIRGMEGEVRHALTVNPETDIIMLHFIYDPFIPTISNGRIPDVILNHERVANHYLIPSINLAGEIVSRMQHGEFDWTKFGGTHPAPFGHKFYAAAINHLFDEMWMAGSSLQPHVIPASPLDKYSYYNGKFVDIRQAELGKGWTYVEAWHPDDQAGKRNGFVDVPMIETTRAGSKLKLSFTGTAVGIFCVAGPEAGVLEYSIDGLPFKQLDMYTEWSEHLYIPWVYMFETELDNKPHRLEVRMTGKGKGTSCQIRNFVVNSPGE